MFLSGLRRALCQIRISAHELKIERDRYKKPYVERSQRICEKCSSNQTEDELHFIINCPLSHPTTGYLDNRCYRELRSYLRHTE
jgi:hypothetical protein